MRRDNHAHARAIAGAALLAAVATGACNTERERAAERAPMQQAERAPTPAPLPTTDVDRVKENPNWYYDKHVRVTGEVDEIFGDRAFRLEGTGWAFDDDITVLMKKPMDAAAGGALQEDDELVVSGTVRRFVVADIERDIGWDLSPEVEIKLKERPVLVADAVRKVGPPQQKVAAAEQQGEVDTVAQVLAVADAKSLAGKKIELGRETVQAVAGKGLWVGPTATEKVFVLPTMMPKDVAVGDVVTISGTMREIPDNALETWNLPKDMADDLGKVVYVEAVSVREVPPEDQRRN